MMRKAIPIPRFREQPAGARLYGREMHTASECAQ